MLAKVGDGMSLW